MLDKARIGLYHGALGSARLLLLAMLSIAPWWYGGAQWQAQLYLVYASMLLAALTWAVTLLSPRRSGSCIRLPYWLLGFMLLVSVQLLPLPYFLARSSSSAQRFAVNVLTSAPSQPPTESEGPAEVALGQESQTLLEPSRHTTLSILPAQTRASLAVVTVAVVAVWSASILFLSSRWAIILAITLATGGILNGFLGLVQTVSYQNWTLLPMPKTETCFATFVSRNSAPGYFATATGAILTLLGIAFRSQKRKRRQEYNITYPGNSLLGRIRNRMEDVFVDLNTLTVSCICLAAFMLVATLATFSRGGAIACLGACLVTFCLALGSRGGVVRATAVASVLALVVGGLMTFFQLDTGLWSRLDQINEIAHTGEDTRIIVWGYTWRALPTYILAGSGLGTYRFALLPFHTQGPNVWFHHAENMPLEIVTETGLLGLIICGVALWIVFRQIYLQSGSQKEALLLVAVIFATSAIALQSIVDFNLILPGVFLPYSVLLGAFLGRCRRVDNEQARIQALGENAYDARKQASSEHHSAGQRNFRFTSQSIGHTVVAVVCLFMAWLGISSLQGYAAAEGLGDRLERFERLITRAQTSQLSYLPTEEIETQKNALESTLERVTSRFAGHPEAELQAGRAEQLLWHAHAQDSIDWGDDFSKAQRWQLANPQVLTSVIRSATPALAPLRGAIHDDSVGMGFARRSFEHFEIALAACPMDARAVWGILTADAKWLSRGSHRTALHLLSKLAGNNPRMLAEASITALQEGLSDEGTRLLKQAVALDPRRLTETITAVAERLSAEQLMEILPQDIVVVAQTGQQIAKLERAKALAGRLVDRVYEQLPTARARTPEGWLALAWVAQQKNDQELQIKLLKSAVSIDRPAIRFELAQALYAAGSRKEALAELEECLKWDRGNPAFESQKKKWTESIDRKP